MDEITKQKILFEISQIDEHLSKSSILIKKCKLQEPDYVELCAIGSIIQSFYNGIENIFLLIAKNVDESVPNKGKWHSELLANMSVCTEEREAVISVRLKTILTDYMNFRHFFRHSYGYSIKWEKVSYLFLELDNNWTNIKQELQSFCK